MSDEDLGKIILLSGCMAAGKTEALIEQIQTSFRLHKARPTILTFWKSELKPDPLNPFIQESSISSRCGTSAEAIGVQKLHDGLEIAEKNTQNPDVFVDEGQFFVDLATVCEEFKLLGKTVTVAALNSRFDLRPWETVSELIAVCDSMTVLKANCDVCEKRQATQTKRITNDTCPIVIAKDAYISCCLRCHRK